MHQGKKPHNSNNIPSSYGTQVTLEEKNDQSQTQATFFIGVCCFCIPTVCATLTIICSLRLKHGLFYDVLLNIANCANIWDNGGMVSTVPFQPLDLRICLLKLQFALSAWVGTIWRSSEWAVWHM